MAIIRKNKHKGKHLKNNGKKIKEMENGGKKNE